MDPKPSRRLNIVRLIMLYVRKFELTCVEESIHYFFLMANIINSDGYNMFVVCVTDLAIETKEYDKIFGKMQRNGVRSRGLLDQFKCADASVEQIAAKVAEQLAQKGLFEDAINMYDIAYVSFHVFLIIVDCSHAFKTVLVICFYLSQVLEKLCYLVSLLLYCSAKQMC